MHNKFKVAVMYGGASGEHEISLISAHWVITKMDPDRYEPVPIGVDKQGMFWKNTLEEVYDPSRSGLKITGPSSKKMYLENSRAHFDIVFPAMHGPLYEDGHLQGALELVGAPFVSSDLLTCAIAMDKRIAKRIASSIGIPVAAWEVIHWSQFTEQSQQAYIEKAICAKFSMPVFVKPMTLGSSVGIHLVENSASLITAVTDALRYDQAVLIEEKINARELEVAILENRVDCLHPRTTAPGEVIVSDQHNFYSYAAKYEDPEGAQTQIPAQISSELSERCQKYASELFVASAGRGLARIDFLYDFDKDQLYFNDFNPLPGLTPISLYPKLWAHTGLSQTDLISELIELALINYKQKQHIQRNYHA